MGINRGGLGSGWWRNLMSRAKKNITETKVLSQIF